MLRRLGFRQVSGQLFVGLAAKGVQIAALRTGHRLFTTDPVAGVLLGRAASGPVAVRAIVSVAWVSAGGFSSLGRFSGCSVMVLTLPKILAGAPLAELSARAAAVHTGRKPHNIEQGTMAR